MQSLVEAPLIAAIVSLLVTLAIWKLFPELLRARWAGALGFAAGFLAAYIRCEKLVVPTTSWQWLVWLVLLAAVVGPVAVPVANGSAWRRSLSFLIAFLAAWLLVPTKTPDRSFVQLIFGSGLVIWWNLMVSLKVQENAIPLACGLVVTSLSAAVLVALEVSLRMGTLGAIGAAALVGAVVLSIYQRELDILKGLLAALAISLGGILLIARLYDVSTAVVALMAISPVTLCLFSVRQFKTLHGRTQRLLQSAAIALPQAIAWGLSLSGL